MISSKAFNQRGSRTDLFADSFDSWIDPAEATTHESPLKNATNTMKWSAWTDREIGSEWPAESAETFKTATYARPAERLLRGVAWAVAALTALLLMFSLLSLGMARWRRPALPAKTTAISLQKRAAWQKVMMQNAFDMARLQAKTQGRSLSEREKQTAAQKAVLQTLNTGGPDYTSFAAAKTMGAVDATLWNLASDGAARGGTLPPPILHRVAAPKTRTTPKPRVEIARTTRRRTPEKQAVILGRGPVREDTSSIILIRD